VNEIEALKRRRKNNNILVKIVIDRNIITENKNIPGGNFQA